MTEQLVKRIVVGVDGSEQAAEALDWAIRFARCLDAEIVAVFAIPPPSYLQYGAGYGAPVVPAELDENWRAQMKELFLQEWCRPLTASGIRYRTFVQDGPPAAVIADLAEGVDADLVVVGRRGRGSVTELLLGSVSHALSHHCSRPVLLISPHASRGGRKAEPAVAAMA